jgi:hypothetical protein
LYSLISSRELVVDHAGAFPEDHIDIGLRRNPLTEELVRGEDHSIDTEGLDHRHRIRGRAGDVGLGFDLSRRVDITDHRHPGVLIS